MEKAQERTGTEQLHKGRECPRMREDRPRLSGGLLGRPRKAAVPQWRELTEHER